MPSIALTAKQIEEITHRKQSLKQCEALALMGIPFRVRHNGTPFVAVTDINLTQQTTLTVEPPTLIAL